MSAVRAAVAAVAVALALVLQVSVFGPLAWEGVVPNLCLLVVVAAALTRGPQFAMVLGFGAGLLLDLAPPADHVAGRWALALLLVGYLVGRVRPESRPTATTVVATVAGASFVGTSVFALSGVVLSDPVVGVGETLSVLAVSLVWDVLLTPFVLPPLMALFRRLEPVHAL
ncbi:rod shape-determining protein MreD [Nocardioides sp. 31GB23]|uniref:Rod shape-determining protein MreD n=1 Tax=Nocardioides salarius TaxID=374513 RepID=A0ABS2M766_9ACTN|nr:rod shape-determining protein MreD [Nocardioides salarius]MBM7507037.1 rod shape-determining protein MreD [Nocardioides salarius]